ncbi:MAG: di-heme oxidoredictase family protein [Burkholderiales bacterium]
MRPDSGADVFAQRWVVAPSAFGMWGRGPTSNAEACTDCHAGQGRGTIPPDDRESLRSTIVRLSVRAPDGTPAPHPAYGSQLQTQGVLGKVPAEGQAQVRWRHTHFRFPDGHTVRLRAPELAFSELAFGQIDTDVMTSLRVAPAVAGAAWLEAIPTAALIDHERAARLRGGQGRLHRVVDPTTGRSTPGRFGWKAGQVTLIDQVATAFLEDLGVTSPRHPRDNCPTPQSACLDHAAAPAPEIDAQRLDALVRQLRSAAPPRPSTRKYRTGAKRFDETGCGVCHVASWPIAGLPDAPAIARIEPYTDLMLHDLGAALADGRPDGNAGPSEWRTAPLWGMRRSLAADGRTVFLHDGRARSVEEAILWHGGEAAPARERFVRLRRADRLALLRFVEGL